jgi:hypothetical protein
VDVRVVEVRVVDVRVVDWMATEVVMVASEVSL